MKKILIFLFLLFPLTVFAIEEVETVDNNDIRVKITLFDYDIVDDATNYPGHLNNTLFNSYTPLKFYAFSNNIPSLGIEDYYTGSCDPVQNIVLDTLNYEGYPVMYNHQDLNVLFDNSDVPYKRIYSDVNHLFVQKDVNSFYFSSDDYYAYLNQDNNTFTLYYPTFSLVSSASHPEDQLQMAGFFPFNQYDPTKTDVSFQSGATPNYYNHHFGMTMEANLYFPESKKINGKDIVFNFSGDDDIWVFLDGKLVLDMGGFHQPSRGRINFTTGVIEYNPDTSYERQVSLDTIANLNELFGNQKDAHNFKVFYLERGGVYSNLTIDTNLWFITREIEDNEPDPEPNPNPEPEPISSGDNSNGQGISNSNEEETKVKNPNTGYNIKNVVIATVVLFVILVVMLFIDNRIKNKTE